MTLEGRFVYALYDQWNKALLWVQSFEIQLAPLKEKESLWFLDASRHFNRVDPYNSGRRLRRFILSKDRIYAGGNT
jgi:hypothetical protein